MMRARARGVGGAAMVVLLVVGCGDGADAARNDKEAQDQRDRDAEALDARADAAIPVPDAAIPMPDAAPDTADSARAPDADGASDTALEALAEVPGDDGGGPAACSAEPRQVANFFGNAVTYRATGVAVDGQSIYLALQNLQEATTGKVVRCPLAGCGEGNRDAVAVVSNVHHPRYLISTGATLFIGAEASVGSQADGYILKCPVAGCPVPFYPQATLAFQLMNLAGIDLAGDHLYFGHTVLASSIGRVHLPTGTRETLIPAPNYGTIGIATDGTYAYWSQQNGPRTIYRVHAATHVVTTLLDDRDGGGHRYSLTHRGGVLYWVGTFSNDVWRMDVDGQNLRKLADGQSQPYALTVSPTHVTWFNRFGAFGIMTTPIDATPATPPRELARSMGQPTAITQGGDCIYWTTEGGSAFTVRH